MPAWLTPPNLLTCLRLVITPLVAVAILQGRHQAALFLVVIAGLTDGADGYLARHFRWQSRLGAYLDPVADKLMLVTVYAALTAAGFAPFWLFGAILLRDLWIVTMVAYAWMATTIRDFPPRQLGKWSTAVQIALAATLLVGNAFPGWVPPIAGQSLIAAVAALAVGSGTDYTIIALKRYAAWRGGRAPGQADGHSN